MTEQKERLKKLYALALRGVAAKKSKPRLYSINYLKNML